MPTIHINKNGHHVPTPLVTLRRYVDGKRVSLRAPLPRVFDKGVL